MVTNTFKCTDNWAQLGNIKELGSLILNNHSKFDLEFYFDPSEILPSDDLSGHRLKGSELFSEYLSENSFVFIRNWFKSLNKNAYGSVSIDSFTWEPLPNTIVSFFLTDLLTSFELDFDADVKLRVTQDGNIQNLLGTGSPLTISSVDSLNEIIIELWDNSYIKFTGQSELLSANLLRLFNVFDLSDFLYNQRELTNFLCSADTSNVINFDSFCRNCYKLISFPFINTSSGVNFNSAFSNLFLITTFPVLDFSSGITFNNCWSYSQSLISFPSLNFPKGETFSNAWHACSLMETFNSQITPLANDFFSAFDACSSLASCGSIDFSNALNIGSLFKDCILLVCISDTIDFRKSNSNLMTFFNCNELLQPPDGSTVRDDANFSSLPGLWTNPGACP